MAALALQDEVRRTKEEDTSRIRISSATVALIPTPMPLPQTRIWVDFCNFSSLHRA